LSQSRKSSEDLSLSDVLPLLDKISGDDSVTVIGGQALNFWAEQSYEECADFAPFTSDDLDFMGSASAAANAASRWGGRLLLPAKFDPAPVNAAVEVSFAGKKRQVQFLNDVFGLGATEAKKSSQQVEVTGVKFLVLDPVACLESRVHNAYGLPGRHTERDLQRVRLATLIVCHRTQVVAKTHPRAALRMVERVFELASSDRALKLFVNDMIDVLEAVPRTGMPPEFYAQRLPQVELWLSDKRERFRKLISRSVSGRKRRSAKTKSAFKSRAK
jgi:hypothetical protein